MKRTDLSIQGYVAGCIADLGNGEEVMISENPKVIYNTLNECLDAAIKMEEEHKKIDPSIEYRGVYGRVSGGYSYFGAWKPITRPAGV